MYIYVITNTATDKIYIGQHKGTNLKQYLQKKLYDAAKHRGGASLLYASMRKHPRDVWFIEPLISGIQTKEALNAWETTLISIFNTRNTEVGYNICRGGEGFTGKHSLSAKAKVTKALKKRWTQPGFREYFSGLLTGRPRSSETIEKIKKARAQQDESTRVEALRAWSLEHGVEAGKRGADTRRRTDPDYYKKLGGMASRESKRRAGQLGAKAGSVKARHTRWHVNRGRINPNCMLCVTGT